MRFNYSSKNAADMATGGEPSLSLNTGELSSASGSSKLDAPGCSRDLDSHIGKSETDAQEEPGDSGYVKQKKKEIEDWSALRLNLETVGVEANLGIFPASCTICAEDFINSWETRVICDDCSPLAIFCCECAIASHLTKPLHHTEIIEVSLKLNDC